MNTQTASIDLAAVALLSVADLSAKLGDLSAEQLADLHALESLREGGPRVTAHAAIIAELEKARGLGDEAAGVALDLITSSPGGSGSDAAGAGATPASSAPPSEAKPEPKPEPKAKQKAEQKADSPKWQAPDYTGPLTGDQAGWRRANLKRTDVVGE